MSIKKLTLIFTVLLFTLFSQAQTKKNFYFFTWGYNRAVYTKSNIHFTGDNYDFTLKKVVAKDRPTHLDNTTIFGTYLNPKFLTIPQFNCHFGRKFKDKWAVSIGWDHMKYVMSANQIVQITGDIATEVSNPKIPTNQYAGHYEGQNIQLTKDFLTFEHTDGYNIVSVDVDRFFNLYRSNYQHLAITANCGAGIAMVVPRSDVRLFGVGANHPWNISGEGLLVKAGLQCHFSKYFYIEAVAKSGATYLQAIPTTGRKGDIAKQAIGFLEGVVQLGVKI